MRDSKGRFIKGHEVPEIFKIKHRLKSKGRHLSPNTEFKPGHTRTKGIKKKVWTEERKESWAVKYIGNKNPFYGRKHSEETKNKLSELNKGMIPWMKGKKHSRESKIKMSIALKGRIAWCKGTKGLIKPNSGSFQKGHIPKNKKGWWLRNGYIEILLPQHPFANKKGYIQKHRFMVEENLGRYLTCQEVVHHINKITNDNRIGNLMCFSSESAHQRFHHNPANVKPEEIVFDGRNHSKIIISNSTVAPETLVLANNPFEGLSVTPDPTPLNE